MKKLLDQIKNAINPRVKKFHKNGVEYPDPTPVEVPLKLLQRHQDSQAYIRAYVQSEIALARMGAEHESVEDAMNFGPEEDFGDMPKTAAELEAEELAQMAQDSYDLRRVRAMVDRDRRWKRSRQKGGSAAAEPGAAAPKKDEAITSSTPIENPNTLP